MCVINYAKHNENTLFLNRSLSKIRVKFYNEHKPHKKLLHHRSYRSWKIYASR